MVTGSKFIEVLGADGRSFSGYVRIFINSGFSFVNGATDSLILFWSGQVFKERQGVLRRNKHIIHIHLSTYPSTYLMYLHLTLTLSFLPFVTALTDAQSTLDLAMWAAVERNWRAKSLPRDGTRMLLCHITLSASFSCPVSPFSLWSSVSHKNIVQQGKTYYLEGHTLIMSLLFKKLVNMWKS